MARRYIRASLEQHGGSKTMTWQAVRKTEERTIIDPHVPNQLRREASDLAPVLLRSAPVSRHPTLDAHR